MISDITHDAMHCSFAGLWLCELAAGKLDEAEFARLRALALESLAEVSFLKDIELPDTLDAFRADQEWFGAVLNPILAERKALGGAVVALPLFLGAFTIWHLHIFAAFGPDNETAQEGLANLRRCLSEVGIDADPFLDDLLERAAGAVTKDEEGGEFIKNSDRRAAAMQSIAAFLDQALERLHGPADVAAQLQALLATVNTGFSKLSAQSAAQHAEVLAQLNALRSTLVERLTQQGLPEAQAQELADTDSPTFTERLKRWASSGKALNAAEAALWAALDFVPGGTAVKLGVKIASAVRKATKG